MVTQPLAIDATIISDGGAYISDLTGWLGLPEANTPVLARYGAHPRRGAPERGGRALRLWTWFRGADLEAQRTALYRALDYENGPLRLTVADTLIPGAAPDGILALFGPWDLHYDAGWKIRDLLQPDDVQATLTGALHVVDGRWSGSRALVIEGFARNRCTNPSFEVDLTGWTAVNAPDTFERVTTAAVMGSASLHVAHTGMAAAGTYYGSRDVSASQTYTGSLYVWGSGTIRVWLDERDAADARINYTEIVHTLTAQPQRISVTRAFSATGVKLRLYVITDSAAAADWYIDAVQLEAGAYPTSYVDGSLAWGTWDGTPHASTSARTLTEVSLDAHAALLSGNGTWSAAFWWQPQYDSDATWPDPAMLFDVYGPGAYDRVYVRYHGNGDYLSVFNRTEIKLASSALTFAAGDWLHIVVTLDYDTGDARLYIDGQLVDSDATSFIAPPTVTQINLGTAYVSSGHGNGAYGEVGIFDYALTAAQVATLYSRHINPRWMRVTTQGVHPQQVGGIEDARSLTADLASDGDTRWRQRDGDCASCELAPDSATLAVHNYGTDDAYPTFRITPRTAKTAGQIYNRWFPVRWPSSRASGGLYPIVLGALNLTGKAQVDGDDIRVYVDGVEADRWLGGTLVSAVKVWFNTTFEPDVPMTLAANIDDAATELTVSGDISALPAAGILYIDSEAITYANRNIDTGVLSGLTRGAKSTTAASHTATTAVYWIQHDVWVYYGDSALAAPTTDDTYEPIIDLDASTNAAWVYAEFGDSTGLRPGAWVYEVLSLPEYMSQYTADHGTDADPWEELGLHKGASGTSGNSHIYVYNPCGISVANFTNGEYWWDGDMIRREIRSGVNGLTWTGEYDIPMMASHSWEAWSRNETLTAGALYVGLRLGGYTSGTSTANDAHLECSDVTLTLTSPPVAATGAEQVNYPLALTIANAATGESITLTADLALNEALTVDTDTYTITRADGATLPTALSQDAARKRWFRLAPGDNALTLTDTGATSTVVEVLWDRRFYE